MGAINPKSVAGIARKTQEIGKRVMTKVVFNSTDKLHMAGYDWSWRVADSKGDTIYSYCPPMGGKGCDLYEGRYLTIEEAGDAVIEHNRKLGFNTPVNTFPILSDWAAKRIAKQEKLGKETP